MKAVSNSSVLISLSIIGQLDLLHKRFPAGILVPAAVWHEVVESAEGRSGAKQVDPLAHHRANQRPGRHPADSGGYAVSTGALVVANYGRVRGILASLRLE